MELETFVHGAMCISYSGRCLLSNFMINRDANRGMCAHPLAEWKYSPCGGTEAWTVLSGGGRRQGNIYNELQRIFA